MRAEGSFSVVSFAPATTDPVPDAPQTALPVGLTFMAKRYEGAVSGRSTTWFVAAYDPSVGGTYLAMECFDGTLDGRAGTFNYVHAAATVGADRSDEFFLIVTGSGTGELAGIHGGGSMTVTADEHLVRFDYELG